LDPNQILNQIEFRIILLPKDITAKDYKSSISAPIIKLRSAIAIGMVMMIVSVATWNCLQQKSEKISLSMGILVFLIMI
jgi:lipoprotein-releasing system permease protein